MSARQSFRASGLQCVVVPAERDDGRAVLVVEAARLDETIGLEPGTRHDPERLDGAAGGLDASALTAVGDREDPGIRVDVAPQYPQVLRERRRNEPVVDHRRRRDV